MLTKEQWDKFDAWPGGLTIDPHDRKAWFMTWWKVNPRNELIFFDEWPREEFYSQNEIRLGTKGYLELIKNFEEGDNYDGRPMKNIIWRYMDPQFGPSRAVSQGRSLQEELLDLGMWFDCEIDEHIPTRHLIVRQRLEARSIVFRPHLLNTIRAMERYIYDDHRRDDPNNVKEKPREAFKDGADCVGYTCMMNPAYFTTEIYRQEQMSPMGL